jgi:hypothetical protein
MDDLSCDMTTGTDSKRGKSTPANAREGKIFLLVFCCLFCVLYCYFFLNLVCCCCFKVPFCLLEHFARS